MKTKFNLVNEKDFYCGKQITANDNRYIFAAVLPNEITIEDDGTKTNKTVVADFRFYNNTDSGVPIPVYDKNKIIEYVLKTLTQTEFNVLDSFSHYKNICQGGYWVSFIFINPTVVNIVVRRIVYVK